MAGDVAPACRIARALLVSRASLYKQRRARRPIVKPISRPVVREVGLDVRVESMRVEDALVILARRHVAYGFRMLLSGCAEPATASIGRKCGGCSKLCGYGLTRPRPHPKAQGRPFDISQPNQLWQADMTTVWCGEDG